MANAALFIINVQLKGMNDFELVIYLTRRLETPPGIIISGNGDEGMLQQALDLDALAFLPKSLEIHTLFECIRHEYSSKTAPQ